MFKKLRNHLIIFNAVVTTIIIVFSFGLIYFVTDRLALSRPLSTNISDIVREQVIAERREAQKSLLSSLFMSGLITECGLIIFSYFWTKDAIHPVEEAYESQKVFIANASHEIKTPLAAIEANLEAADIKGNRWIDNISNEVKSLQSLDQQLLALARADNLETVSHQEETELGELVKNLINSFESRIQAKQINFNFKNRTKNAKITLNKTDFEQILSILMDNAIKYCRKTIKITLENDKISVKNDGATLTPEDTKRIFERFYQVDKSSAGTGLGLAIAKSIASKNNWELEAKSDKLTTFTLKF